MTDQRNTTPPAVPFLSLTVVGIRLLRQLARLNATDAGSAVQLTENQRAVAALGATEEEVDRTFDALIANGFAGNAGAARYYLTAKGDRAVRCREFVRVAADCADYLGKVQSAAAEAWEVIPDGLDRNAVNAAEHAVRDAEVALVRALERIKAAVEVTR